MRTVGGERGKYMEPIKLIVTDLDGTFLNGYHDLNEENIRAVRAAREHGIVVAPVTARNFDCARYAILSSEFDPLCVMSNGAAIVDSRDLSHRFSNFIDPASVRAIVEAAIEAEASIEVFTTPVSAMYRPTMRKMREEHMRRWAEKPSQMQPNFVYFDDLDEMMREVESIAENITLHGKDLAELPGWLFRRVVEQGEFYLTSSHNMCIDIMAYGSTKWEGVQHLANILGIGPQNVMSFGDNSNDIGMIRWAGIGVAMGNAPEPVKRIADVVAAKNTENGFATIVYDLIEKQGNV